MYDELKEEFEKEVAALRSEGLKFNSLRLEYEEKVRELSRRKNELFDQGCSEEAAARLLHGERRHLGEIFKDAAPPLFREYIFFATAQKYGDPLGPQYEQLRQTKSAAEIIESAARPIRDLDDRLTIDGFEKWFREKYSCKP